MATIAEFREFFIRNVKVLTGFKKDQQVNYPTTYTVDINGVQVQVSNRLIKGAYPSADVMAKLLQSMTFKLNVEDTATTTIQGLVKIATLNQCQKGTDYDANSYQYVPKPSEIIYLNLIASLPTVPGNFKSGDLFLNIYANDINFGSIYTSVNATSTPPTFNYEGKTHPIPTNGNTGDILVKNSNTPFDISWGSSSTPVGTKSYRVYVTQTSTNAPTITTIQDTITGIISAYVSAGVYSLNKTGAFPAAKTFIKFAEIAQSGTGIDGIIAVGRVNDDQIAINTTAIPANTADNGLLTRSYIEIIVLP